MRCFFAVSLLLLVFMGHAFAQRPDAAAEKSKLIALENAWNQAQIHRDGKALNELVADAFIYTDWDGTVMHKAKFIADIKDPSTVMTLVANDDVEVYFYPGTAIVAGAYHAKGTSQGKPFDHHGRFTDTWILSVDKWQCVASHTNLVKK
jgi:hypothetical protein